MTHVETFIPKWRRVKVSASAIRKTLPMARAGSIRFCWECISHLFKEEKSVVGLVRMAMFLSSLELYLLILIESGLYDCVQHSPSV